MISAQYLGMPLEINDLDHENLAYFGYCAKHDFRLQRCASCKLFRYPPSTACPWCAELTSEWVSVEGRGTVHSYTEVHHAIQPAFKQYTPYLVLLVELDTQSGKPTKEEGLRVIGNLTRPDGVLAPKTEVERVGIGTRARMVFTDVAPGLALPQRQSLTNSILNRRLATEKCLPLVAVKAVECLGGEAAIDLPMA
jgi:uncharacterized OB-fold protein